MAMKIVCALLGVFSSIATALAADQCLKDDELLCLAFREQARVVGLLNASRNLGGADAASLHRCCSLVGLHFNEWDISRKMVAYPPLGEVQIQQVMLAELFKGNEAEGQRDKPWLATKVEDPARQKLQAIYNRFYPFLPWMGQRAKVFAGNRLIIETGTWGMTLPGAVVVLDRDYVFNRPIDSVAFTLAHELGHAVQRHYLECALLKGEDPYAFMKTLAKQPAIGIAQKKTEVNAAQPWSLIIDRREEMDADLFAVALTMVSGFGAEGLIRDLAFFQSRSPQDMAKAEKQDLEHPLSAERIAYIRLAIQALQMPRGYASPIQAFSAVPKSVW